MNQRIIKFRAWDGKKMHPTYELGVSDFFNNIPTPTGYEHYTLMQFTGLTDKNGKEIFEGDIITDQWGVKTEVKIEEFFHSDYEDSTYGYGFALVTHTPEEFKKMAEVIGNVFENPELLTETPK